MSQSLQAGKLPSELPFDGKQSPPTRRVRIVGLLDGIEASTRENSAEAE